MKVDVTDGRITVASADLAPLLDLDANELRERMRDGRISTLSESGKGEDAGRLRVTFQTDGWKVRLICAPDGTVLQRLRTPTAKR